MKINWVNLFIASFVGFIPMIILGPGFSVMFEKLGVSYWLSSYLGFVVGMIFCIVFIMGIYIQMNEDDRKDEIL